MDKMDKAATEAAECPSCHATIAVHFGYVTWCDRCGWNIQPLEPTGPRSLVESLCAAIGRGLSQKLLEDAAGASVLRPSWMLSKALAFIFASLVHGVTAACLGLGLWLANHKVTTVKPFDFESLIHARRKSCPFVSASVFERPILVHAE